MKPTRVFVCHTHTVRSRKLVNFLTVSRFFRYPRKWEQLYKNGHSIGRVNQSAAAAAASEAAKAAARGGFLVPVDIIPSGICPDTMNFFQIIYS